jgi:hypothetical protein
MEMTMIGTEMTTDDLMICLELNEKTYRRVSGGMRARYGLSLLKELTEVDIPDLGYLDDESPVWLWCGGKDIEVASGNVGDLMRDLGRLIRKRSKADWWLMDSDDFCSPVVNVFVACDAAHNLGLVVEHNDMMGRYKDEEE